MSFTKYFKYIYTDFAACCDCFLLLAFVRLHENNDCRRMRISAAVLRRC